MGFCNGLSLDKSTEQNCIVAVLRTEGLQVASERRFDHDDVSAVNTGQICLVDHVVGKPTEKISLSELYDFNWAFGFWIFLDLHTDQPLFLLFSFYYNANAEKPQGRNCTVSGAGNPDDRSDIATRNRRLVKKAAAFTGKCIANRRPGYYNKNKSM